MTVGVSPETLKRIRKLGVRGMATALAAKDLASKQLELMTEGSGGLVSQVGRRVLQLATELQEEWEHFLAEARAERSKIHIGQKPRNQTTSRRRRTSPRRRSPSKARAD